MAAENDLGRDDIKKIVVRIAIPSMLAQFVSVLYSIVDRMYIGNIPGSGDMALAGAGVCGPVVTMVGSVAFLVGIGGAPLMSMKMGQGDKKAAERILANCFLMLAVCSLLMVACIYPIRIPMLRYFGASDITLPYANAYFTIYLTGTVFALMSTGMNQFIICQGFAKTGMYSVVLGAGAEHHSGSDLHLRPPHGRLRCRRRNRHLPDGELRFRPEYTVRKKYAGAYHLRRLQLAADPQSAHHRLYPIYHHRHG